MASTHADRSTASGARRGVRHLRHALLALCLALSGVADACTLNALLRLPLERLLELNIGVQRVAQDSGSALRRAHRLQADVSSHAH